MPGRDGTGIGQGKPRGKGRWTAEGLSGVPRSLIGLVPRASRSASEMRRWRSGGSGLDDGRAVVGCRLPEHIRRRLPNHCLPSLPSCPPPSNAPRAQCPSAMDISFDATWCLVCSRQILPKRYQVLIPPSELDQAPEEEQLPAEEPALAPAPPPTTPTARKSSRPSLTSLPLIVPQQPPRHRATGGVHRAPTL